MTEKIRVLLIDDHPLFRKGVGQIISDDPSFEIVGEAASGQEGIDLALEVKPDLVLLDLNMKGMDGLETLRRFKETDLDAHYVVLTVSDAEENLLEALRIGADGYLLKDMEPEDLRNHLLKAAVGVTVLQDSMTEILKKAFIDPQHKVSADEVNLTVRENVAFGLKQRGVARKLDIRDTTVKVHIKNILRKLNLTSRLEAVVWKHQQDGR